MHAPRLARLTRMRDRQRQVAPSGQERAVAVEEALPMSQGKRERYILFIPGPAQIGTVHCCACCKAMRVLSFC